MKLPTRTYKLLKGERMLTAVTKHGFRGADVEKIFKAKFNSKIQKLRKKYTDVTAGDEIELPLITKKHVNTIRDMVLELAYAVSDDLTVTEDLLERVELDIKAAKERRKNISLNGAELRIKCITESKKVDQAFSKCTNEAKNTFLGDFLGTCKRDFERSSKIVDGLCDKYDKLAREQEAKASALISELEEKRKTVLAQVESKLATKKALDRHLDSLSSLASETF